MKRGDTHSIYDQQESIALLSDAIMELAEKYRKLPSDFWDNLVKDVDEECSFWEEAFFASDKH